MYKNRNKREGVSDLVKVKIEFFVVVYDYKEVIKRVSATTRCFLPDQKIFFLLQVIAFLTLNKRVFGHQMGSFIAFRQIVQ